MAISVQITNDEGVPIAVDVKLLPFFITEPTKILGITPASIYVSGDAFGEAFFVTVPKNGIIQAAMLFDHDNEGTEIDLQCWKGEPVPSADHDPVGFTDQDLVTQITEIKFVVFSAYANNQVSEVLNIGVPYELVPEDPDSDMASMWLTAVTRATPTIGAGAEPHIILKIIR